MSLTCGCDTDGPEFFSQKNVKAKKAHKCSECGREIVAGETYERIAGKWDGCFDVFKTCSECEDLRDSMEAMGFCPAFGEVRSDHREYIAEYKPQAINGSVK